MPAPALSLSPIGEDHLLRLGGPAALRLLRLADLAIDLGEAGLPPPRQQRRRGTLRRAEFILEPGPLLSWLRGPGSQALRSHAVLAVERVHVRFIAGGLGLSLQLVAGGRRVLA